MVNSKSKTSRKSVQRKFSIKSSKKIYNRSGIEVTPFGNTRSSKSRTKY